MAEAKKKCSECNRPERVCDNCARRLCCSGPLTGQVRGSCNDCGYAWRSCQMCGEFQRWDEPEHASIERVVRAGCNFGGTKAGERVRVEPDQVDLPNVQQATMSLEEAAALEKHRREATPKKAEPPKIIEGLSRALEAEKQRSEQQISAGRRRLKREADVALGNVRNT